MPVHIYASQDSPVNTHGVSGSATDWGPDSSSAPRSDLEDAGFPVHDTPSRRDPGHVTIELPIPVENEDADKFNDVFGRDG